MSKSDDIVIFENPQKGMAPDPFLGIGLLRNIDIVTYPGRARLIKAMAKQSGSVVTALVQWIVKDPAHTANLYALDAAGQVYTSTNGGSSWATLAGETAGGTGQGMAIWKDYLFVARATTLDVYGPLASGPGWTNSWKTDLDATADFHPMFTSIDDCLYIGCGKYVYKIKELTTFVPATAASYTATARAITLAANYNIKCINELGTNLMLGTWFGTTAALYDKVADIFPYSRSSLTLGIPIHFEENGIHAMTVVGNRLYAIAGATAKLFITDGSSASLVAQVPSYAVNVVDAGGYFNIYPDAIMYHRGKLFLGLGSSSLPANGNCGIWSYDLNAKTFVLENTLSTTAATGNDGASAELEIGSLFSLGSESFLAGWKDFTGTPSSGIDLRANSTFITSYGGIIHTQMVQVGLALANRTIQSVEFILAKPLLSGQGIKVYYQKDLYSGNGFTLLGTVDFATNGGIQSFNLSAASITNAVLVQFKLTMTTGGNDSPELVRVILHPSL